MFKRLLNWILRKDTKEKNTKPLSQYEEVKTYLGEVDELAEKTFKPGLANRLEMTATCKSISELEDDLYDAVDVVCKGGYFDDVWKVKNRTSQQTSLGRFITHQRYLIHPVDWIRFHHSAIGRLFDAFEKMDTADQAYYRRLCSFVLDDIHQLCMVSRKALC